MGMIIPTKEELKTICDKLHKDGKRIVTTNGVFDLIHVGHVRYLQFCKSQGDILLVGVNSDSSVKQYKGDKRPILPESDRAELMAAFACVDYVFIFSDRTPEAFLEIVKPAFHVKAGDYTLDQSKETPKTKIWERDIVEKHGGKCLLAPLVQGKSTTSIIEKIKDVYGNNNSPKRPAVFLDRDGTIIVDKHYQKDPAQLEFIPGSIDALKRLQDAGYRLIILTNQSGIARGMFTEVEAERFSQAFITKLSDSGVRLDAVYFCPHHPEAKIAQFKKACSCRKPKPGMAIQALQEHSILLENSFVIGDKTVDVALGPSLGIPSILVKTGKAGQDKECEVKPAFEAKDLQEAADWILSR